MPVILVIIIMVAWLVILGPNLLKRRSRTVAGISSISHFHRQLRVLEHSAPPPLVTPAYRLRAADGSAVEIPGSDGGRLGLPPKLSVVGADKLPRPALAFLGDDPTGGGADGPSAGSPVAGGGVLPALGRTPLVPTAPRLPDVHARSLARRRRRDTLGVLSAVFVTTALLGFIPGAGMAWLFSVVSGLILTAYVTLLVRMRRTAEERERKLHYLPPDTAHGPEAVGTSVGAVGALPLGVTRLPVRVSGRYAHPSNQAVGAR